MVKIKNLQDDKVYLLFLQCVLVSKFKEINAKSGDVLAVFNKGKDMQTGYDYLVAPWKSSFNIYRNKKEHLKKILVDEE